MERAGVRCTVTKECDRDPWLVAHREGKSGANHGRDATTHDRVRAKVAALNVVEVHRSAVAVRAALHLSVELSHHGVRVGAAGKGVAVCAVR